MENDRGGGMGPWADWARLIVSGLEDQAKRDDRIEAQGQANRIEIEKLKVEIKIKSSVFGFVGAAIPVFLFFMYEILKKVIK